MAIYKFAVDGKPVPQGSMRYIGNGRMIHNRAKDLAVWRATIAYRAKEIGCKPIVGPIKISLIFGLQRPKTVKREQPIVAPDLDKLIRGVLDALTGIAYVDDAQVVDILARKVYSEHPGVDIEIADGFDIL